MQHANAKTSKYFKRIVYHFSELCFTPENQQPSLTGNQGKEMGMDQEDMQQTLRQLSYVLYVGFHTQKGQKESWRLSNLQEHYKPCAVFTMYLYIDR